MFKRIKKVDMLTAARNFKAAIDKNCKVNGYWIQIGKTNILLYKDYNSDSNSDKIIVVRKQVHMIGV